MGTQPSEPSNFKQSNIATKIILFSGLIAFNILLLAIDEYFIDYIQVRYFLKMLFQEYRPERPPLAYFSFIFGFCWMVVYCWATFRASRPVRILLSIFFMLAVFIEYGYFLTFHRLMSALDFWTAMYSPLSLWTEAIGMYINLGAIVISMIFILGVAFNWKKPRSRWLPEVILAVFIAISLVLPAFQIYDKKTGNSVLSFVQLLGSIKPSEQMIVNRDEVPPIEHNSPQNNIVFVIDESLRGDHLTINGYSRDTTPTLKNLMDHGFVNTWGLAVSSTTCSYSSNPHILTGALSTVEGHNLVSTWPTIFQYAHAMGYRTYYLDAQENYLWNGLTPSDKKYIDIWKNSNDFGDDYSADQRAARFIWQELHTSVGNFILLNKKGMHIKYEKNYPENEGLWFPTPPDMNYRINQPLVINAYDNAVHYNLETFFKFLLPEGKPLSNTVILYTSDHGETLQEQGEAWSHCSNTSPEATVPLFLIGNVDNQPDTNYEASHSNIFPTLLDLMDVPESARQEQYNYSLLKANADMNQPRYFFGDETNPILYIPIQ